MSGRRKRRAEARARRAFSDAWHDPPCPDAEPFVIDSISRCVTLDDEARRLMSEDEAAT